MKVRTLFSSAQIQSRIDELVDEIQEKLRIEPNGPLVVIGILRGSFIFLADLVRALDRHALHPQIDFLTLQSYGSATESSGNVEVLKDVSVRVQGSTVLLIDDILDSGRTLNFAVNHMQNKGAGRIFSCNLLDKPSRRVVPVSSDFVGFEVPDLFVIGYGLDYDNRYRELPYIAEYVEDDGE